MAEKIKNGDFIEVEYTGKVEGMIFDTTDEAKAKKLGIFNQGAPYGGIIVCVGKEHLLKGLDKAVVGKEVGSKFNAKLIPEDAFGKKQANMIKLMPKNKFTAHDINPQPGLQVTVDGSLAIIKSITGNRVLVDFNHPFSGKEVEYDIEIKRRVDDKAEQVKAVLRMELNVKDEAYELDLKDKKATINFKEGVELPQEILDELTKRIKDSTDIEASFKI